MRLLPILILLTASCMPDQHAVGQTQPARIAEQTCGSARPDAISSDWDPNFTGEDVAKVRAIGGYYRAIAATSFEQHRSTQGPTFRLSCSENLRVRILFGVPPAATDPLTVRLVALVDYKQADFEFNSTWARSQGFTLARGEEHLFEIALRPMADGVHRLVVAFLEDDDQHGLFGAYDLIADVYVGRASRPLPISAPQSVTERDDPSVRGAGYGIRLSTEPNVIQLAGNVPWAPSRDLFVSLWGSASEGPRPVALVALQDFDEIDIGLTQPLILAKPSRVSLIRFRPRQPRHTAESIRVFMITGPDQEIAPRGTYEAQRQFKAYASQKAWIRLP
jgi:hypothetical protein